MGATAAVAVVAALGTAYSANESRNARKDQEESQKKAKREAQQIEAEKPKAVDPAAAARRRAVVSANQLGRSDTILAGGAAGGPKTILGG